MEFCTTWIERHITSFALGAFAGAAVMAIYFFDN